MKSYPSQISINQLADLTGRDRRTITRLLEGAESDAAGRYEIREAIRLIFEFFPDEEENGIEFYEGFQPMLEKAKLDYMKRKDLELDMEVKKGELIPKQELRGFLSKIFSSVRARCLGIHVKAAQQITPSLTREQVESLRKIVEEVLTDLSDKRLNGKIG